MPWPQDDQPLAPQPTPFGQALWKLLTNAVPAQLNTAGNLAAGVARPFTNLFGNGGQEFWQGPQNPQAANDMRQALLTMMPTGAPQDAALASGMRVYRGSNQAETWPSSQRKTFWASSNPEVAVNYANQGYPLETPNIAPADLNARIPLTVDAKGNNWDQIPADSPELAHLVDLSKFNPPSPRDGYVTTTDAIARAARDAGHDAVIFRNIQDSGPVATTIAALKPGTVTSPLTGETLFAGGQPNPFIAALLGLVGRNALNKGTNQ